MGRRLYAGRGSDPPLIGRLRLWPRNLAGQIALLVALALFLAQAINFALILAERQRFRLESAVGPVAARVIDASQNNRLRRPEPPDERGHDRDRDRPFPDSPWDLFRVRPITDNPIPAGLKRRPDIEEGLRRSLTEANIHVGRIVTGIRDIDPHQPRFDRMSVSRAQRFRSAGGELLIAIEQPGRGWWAINMPWQDSDWPIVSRLIGQTLIIYAVILLPMLWATRRISRPLRSLADAARRFRPGDEDGAIEESGPGDVRVLIAAFNALRLRVTAMLAEKDRMLGAIGHDLRTPLAALRVRIESVEDDDDRARMADTIDEMNRTLDDILSLARLGRPSEPAVEVDLAALVDAVVEDFRDLGEPVTFEETDRLRMHLRPSLMRRAVRNLIENAVKYGGSAEVRISTTPATAEIVVLDHGPGIPEERIDEVFEAFTRLEGSRNKGTGGIGLGLALAGAIVRDAGGAIELRNRAEGGLSATITLPR